MDDFFPESQTESSLPSSLSNECAGEKNVRLPCFFQSDYNAYSTEEIWPVLFVYDNLFFLNHNEP